jgi:16S rRNA (guanine527-N7)-methyltransferase
MLPKEEVLLHEGCQQLGLAVEDATRRQWLAYLTLLQKWNTVHNLIGDADLETIIVRHLLDSLSIASYIQGSRIMDMGTGAGFPGLPLAILLPQYHWVLLDARQKRCQFLQHVVSQLELTQVDVQHQRVETFYPTQIFDQILCRAVGSANDLINISSHLLKPLGSILMMKGRSPHAELVDIDTTAWKSDIVTIQVPFLAEERHLLVLRAVAV